MVRQQITNTLSLNLPNRRTKRNPCGIISGSYYRMATGSPPQDACRYTVQRHGLCISSVNFVHSLVIFVLKSFNSKATKFFTKVTTLIPAKWRSTEYVRRNHIAHIQGGFAFLYNSLASSGSLREKIHDIFGVNTCNSRTNLTKYKIMSFWVKQKLHNSESNYNRIGIRNIVASHK